jgi:tetratricopeptide (TPR) repeat protein
MRFGLVPDRIFVSRLCEKNHFQSSISPLWIPRIPTQTWLLLFKPACSSRETDDNRRSILYKYRFNLTILHLRFINVHPDVSCVALRKNAQLYQGPFSTIKILQEQNSMKPNRLAALFFLFFAVILLAGCGGPEAKKMKFFDKGNELYTKGDYVAAGTEFNKALEIDPKFADGYFMLGKVALHIGNPDMAFKGFIKAVQLNPRHLKAHVEIGKLLLLAGAPDKALAKAESILKTNPGNEDALLLKGAVMISKKETDQALQYLYGLMQQGIKNPEAYLLMSAAYLSKGDRQNAANTLLSGIKTNPESAQIYAKLANLYIAVNRIPEALTAIQKLIELEPGNAKHQLTLANLHWATGNRQKAVDILKEMTNSDAENENKWIQVTKFYLSKKLFQNAEAELKEGLKENEKSFKIRFVLADLYLGTGRTNDATAILMECLTLDNNPTNPEIVRTKNGLAKVYLRSHKTDEARRYINDVLKSNPNDFEARFLKGNIHLAGGEAMNAIAEYKIVVKARPQLMIGQIRLAEAYAMNNEITLATETLQNALKSSPNSRDARRAMGRILKNSQDYKQAEAQYRQILETNPNDLEVKADLGDLFLAAKDFTRAEAEYADIKKLAPGKDLGYAKLGEYYTSLEKWNLASSELETAVKLNPRSVPLYTLLVRSYVEQKKYSEAIATCESRIRTNPRDALSYNLIGQTYALQKNFDKANAAFQRAITLQPLWPVPINNLAKLYLDHGMKDAAVKKFEEAVRTNPNNMIAYLSLGQLYEQSKDYPKAILIYERLLLKQPNFWTGANNLAFLLSDHGRTPQDLDRALGLAQKANTARPDDPEILDTLGWVYYKKGDVKSAATYLGRAYTKSPGSSVINYHLGMALYKQDKYPEAKEKLKKAVASKEDFYGKDEAQKVLAKI